MDDDKKKHARAQRKHAAKLKRKGVPRSDDLARALLAALRAVAHDAKYSTAQVEKASASWIARAVRQLEERGFKRRHAIERFVRTVFPDTPVRRIEGSRVIPSFDLNAIVDRIDQALLQEDEARRRESEKTDDQSAC